MSGGLLFRIAGIPVRVLPFFFLVAILFGFGYEDPVLIAAWVGVMFLGILLHELGHAFTYRAFGVDPHVVLHGFGGLTFGRSLPVAKDLAVSLAGPAVGLVIGGAIWLVDPNVVHRVGTYNPNDIAGTVLGMAFFVNFFWAVLNLLPIMPLDGGNATNALLSLLFRRDMTRATRFVSIATGAVLIVVALYAEYLFSVVLLAWFLFMNVQGLMQERRRETWQPPANLAPPPATSSDPSSPVGPPAPPPAEDPSWYPPPAPPIDPAPPGTWGPMPSAPPTVDGPVPLVETAEGEQLAGAARGTPKGRTFGDEMTSATRSLATGHPEVAALAVDRARRLATNADEHAAVDRLEAHVAQRLDGPD